MESNMSYSNEEKNEMDESEIREKVAIFDEELAKSDYFHLFSPAVLTYIDKSLQVSFLQKIAIKGSVSGFRLTDNHVSSLVEAITKSNIQLLDLSLTYHNITDVGLEEISRLLHPPRTLADAVNQNAPSSLEGLDLEGNDITGSTLACTNLTEFYDCSLLYLNLSCNPLNEYGRVYLAEIAEKNRTIRQLSINCVSFDLTSLIAFITNLHGNSCLQLLYLDRPLLHGSSEDDMSTHIGRVLIQNTCALFDLSLRYCNITNYGAKLLADALMVNDTLLNINLECNRIGDIGAEALASYLISRGPNSVRFLGLSNNMIGDDGANALAEALRANTTVSHLTLKNNKICSTGLSSFVEALNENSVLESLTLFGNKFSNANGKQYLEFIKYRMPATGIYLDVDIYVVDGQYKVAEN